MFKGVKKKIISFERRELEINYFLLAYINIGGVMWCQYGLLNIVINHSSYGSAAEHMKIERDLIFLMFIYVYYEFKIQVKN